MKFGFFSPLGGKNNKGTLSSRLAALLVNFLLTFVNFYLSGGRNLLRNRKTTPLPRLAALLVTNGKRWKENRSKSSKKKQKG